MKKALKKIFAFFMVAALSLMATGCNGNNKNSGNIGGDGYDSVFVSVVDAGFGSDWIEAVGAAYYEETGVLVEVTADPDIGNSVLTKMGTNAEKEDIYFCAQATSIWRQWAYRGYLEPLEDVLENTKYGKAAVERAVDDTMLGTGTFYNTTYLTPYDYSNWGLIYNQNLLDQIDSFGEYEKGVWPETVQGLLDLCKATKAANIVMVTT